MTDKLGYLQETPSQTAGPYVHIGLIPHQAGFDIFQNNFGNVVAGPSAKGERIRIEGRVIDGSGTPVRDVLVETWQAGGELVGVRHGGRRGKGIADFGMRLAEGGGRGAERDRKGGSPESAGKPTEGNDENEGRVLTVG